MRSARKITKVVLSAVIAVGLGVTGALVGATSASAVPDTFTVTSPADDGGGPLLTIDEAVDMANTNGNPGDQDIIRIDPSLSGATLLIDDQLFITQGVSIEGLSSDTLTIERSGVLPTFDFFAFAPTAAGMLFSIDGMTIEGDGVKTGSGIAITNFTGAAGEIDIFDVNFIDLVSASGGPGIVATGVDGTIFIQNCRFDGNRTTADGGAVRFDDAGSTIALRDSVFEDNEAEGAGGAVHVANSAGALISHNSRFELNESGDGGGGAVYVGSVAGSGGFLASDFIANSTTGYGGAVYVDAVATGGTFGALASNFIDNQSSGNGQSEYGGGAFYAGSVDGILVLDSSTFSQNELNENTQRYGRSLAVDTVDGLVQIVNSTFDELDETPVGIAAEFAIAIAAVGADGLVQTLHSTITATGALRLGSNAGDVRANHTLFDAFGAADAIEISILPSAPVVVDWSLLTTDHEAVFVTDAGNNEFDVATLGLNPLADNGGPTQTRLPSATSPAREAGDPAFTGEPEFDQRGEGFPRVLTVIDIGAVETQFILPPTGATINPVLPIGALVLLVLGIGAVVFVWVNKRRHG